MNEDLVAEAIRRMVWPSSGESVLSIKEIARLLNRAESTVYGQVQEGRWAAWQFLTIAQEALRRDYQELSTLALIAGTAIVSVEAGKTDGSICDDITEEVTCLGKINEHFKAGNIKAARAEVAKARKELATVEAEINRASKR